jgi:hypothetical protein
MGDNSVGPGHLGCNCADSQLIRNKCDEAEEK